MYLPLTVTLELTPGKTPNTLQGVLRVASEDGTVYDETEPQPIEPGNTIEYGPLFARVELPSKFSSKKTPPPPAPGAPGAQVAGKVGPVAGRR